MENKALVIWCQSSQCCSLFLTLCKQDFFQLRFNCSRPGLRFPSGVHFTTTWGYLSFPLIVTYPSYLSHQCLILKTPSSCFGIQYMVPYLLFCWARRWQPLALNLKLRSSSQHGGGKFMISSPGVRHPSFRPATKLMPQSFKDGFDIQGDSSHFVLPMKRYRLWLRHFLSWFSSVKLILNIFHGGFSFHFHFHFRLSSHFSCILYV